MLLVWAIGSWAPLVWAKGSWGLSETWSSLLGDLQQQGWTVVVILEARGRQGLPPMGAFEWVPPGTTVSSRVSKKNKEGMATEHHPLLLSPS